MIAALRTTLALVLVVLACSLAPTPAATAAPTVPTMPAVPMRAAECDPLDLDNPTAVRERADAVTDVFAGKVREIEALTAIGGGEDQPNQGPEPSDGPTRTPDTPDRRITRWQHTVVVDIPFRSALQTGDRVLVVTQLAGEPGGLGKLDQGATYVFFVNGGEGMDHLLADACAGTTKLPGGLSADLRDQLDDTLREPTGDEPTPDYTLAAPEDGARSAPSLGRLAAPGVALALIGVLGLLLLARVGSSRRQS